MQISVRLTQQYYRELQRAILNFIISTVKIVNEV